MDENRLHSKTTTVFCLVVLFFMLLGFYLLTYQGFPLSIDEHYIYDMTESFVNRGNFYRTYTFTTANPTASTGIPWGDPLQEPLMPIVTAPFFMLGKSLSQAGTMHIVWLTNLFITAFTAVSLTIGAILWGYRLRVAWFTGLLYGATTLAWPYSRHLFREPLMTFFILWCFILAGHIHHSWDKQHHFSWRIGTLFIASFIGAFFTKSASILILPALFIILFPINHQLKNRRVVVGLGISIALLITVIILSDTLDITNGRYSLSVWVRKIQKTQWHYVVESLLGYQFSPGRSIWLYSPILLLSIPGIWQLKKQNHWRNILAPAIFILALSAAYGMSHRQSWWGSWGWGPRYMLPALPVVVFYWVLPLLDHLKPGWPRKSVGALAIFSGSLQLLGMSVRLSNYYTDLNWAGILTDWRNEPDWAAYNWSWDWSPIIYNLRELDFQYLDFGWRSADPKWLGPILAIILLSGSLSAVFYLFRLTPLSLRRASLIIVGVSIMAFVAIGGGLQTLRDDPRYLGKWTDVRKLIIELDQQATDEQVIFVDREQYALLFMNNFKTPALVAILPYAPGEVYGSYEPLVVSDDVEELAGKTIIHALKWTAEHYHELWLVASSGPFDSEKLRPAERYLVENYFPVSEIVVSQQARAIHFLTTAASQEAFTLPTTINFDDMLSLAGFDLPAGTEFNPGDIVPISLIWNPLETLPQDYNISVQIVDSDGEIIAQRDGAPQATFGFTSRWQVGEQYRDNHGLQLPLDIPTGTYMIQVIVYRWQDGQRLTITSTDSPEILERDIAHLIEITVTN